MNKFQPQLFIVAFIFFAFARLAPAQTATFTYQGRLTDASAQANGTYDLGFALFDAATGGTQIGAAQTRAAVNVTNGVFTVQLDFGAAAFPGADRYLQIAVKRPADANFTTLTPRQQVTSTPYAIRAISATTADTATTATNSAQLGGTAANQFVQTADARLSDARTPTAGSANYIQNRTTAQTSANFNIDGTGAASVFNAQTQYNIGGSRVLFTDGESGANTFVGLRAGRVNTGILNVFIGNGAGSVNGDGGSNSFVGAQAGQSNTTGNFNAFFGRFAGFRNTSGESNSFLGAEAGTNTTTGAGNAFVGAQAGNSNRSGSNNSALGAFSNVVGNNLNFATAVGSFAVVSASDTIVIGKTVGTYSGASRPADAVQIPGTLTVTGAINGTVSNATNAANATNATNAVNAVNADKLGNVAASNYVQTNDSRLTDARAPTAGSANYIQNGTTQQISASFNISGDGTTGGTLSGNAVNSATQYNLGGNRVLAQPSLNNLFVGTGAAPNFSSGSSNTFIGRNAGVNQVDGNGNTFVGRDAGGAKTSGTNNTIIGSFAGIPAGVSSELSYATAIGAGSEVIGNNTIALGRTDGSDRVQVYGRLSVNSLPGGGSVQLCSNPSNLYIVSQCSSSLRYKTNVAPFRFGLSVVKQLRPISFDWKEGGMHDLGFGAEDVAAVNPLLVNYNKEGQVEGVKYDRFSALFVNAFKEQQTQIEAKQEQLDALQKRVEQQQTTIDALKQLLCAQNPTADVCRQP